MLVGLLPLCELDTCPGRGRLWPRILSSEAGIVFEGRHLCGPECLEDAVAETLHHLLPIVLRSGPRTHRLPIGLLMVSRGVIDDAALKTALGAQRKAGRGRLGEWLRSIVGVSEQQVTATLGMQWSCPVFPLADTRNFMQCAEWVPLPILESERMVPAHYLPSSRLLYVAFAERVAHGTLHAMEKVLECRTRPCVSDQSTVERALAEIRRGARPHEVTFDSMKDPREMARVTRDYAVNLGAREIRAAVCAEYIWLRLKKAQQVTSLVFRAA